MNIVEEIAKHARFEPLDHAAMDGMRLCKVSRAPRCAAKTPLRHSLEPSVGGLRAAHVHLSNATR